MALMLLISTAVAVTLVLVLLFHQAGLGWAHYQRALRQRSQQGLREWFVFLDTRQFGLLATGAATAGAVLVYVASASASFSLLAGVALLTAPFLVLGLARARRRRQAEQQLPEFMLSLALSLQAGHSLSLAFQSLADSTNGPLGLEFLLLLRQQRLGMSVEDSQAQLQKRLPLEGVTLLMTLFTLGARTGAGLGTVLLGMAEALRSQLAMQERLHALTAQARMQARVMLILPVLVAWALYALDRDGFLAAWAHPVGRAAAGLIVLMQALGLYWIRCIIQAVERSC